MLSLGSNSMGAFNFVNPKNLKCSCVVGKSSLISDNCNIIVKSESDIDIGSDVYIGKRTSIESGVKIGNGVIIGVDCYINYDIPDYAMVKKSLYPTEDLSDIIISYRYDKNIINFLNDIKWWDWTSEQKKINKWFFGLSLNKYSVNSEAINVYRGSEKYISLEEIKSRLV